MFNWLKRLFKRKQNEEIVVVNHVACFEVSLDEVLGDDYKEFCKRLDKKNKQKKAKK